MKVLRPGGRVRELFREIVGRIATPRVVADAPVVVDPEHASIDAPQGMAGLLTGRRVAVTGAGKDLGRALCEAMLEAGAEVVAIDRDRDALEALRGDHPSTATYECDVSQTGDIERLWSEITSGGAGCDTLVHNASFQVRPPRGLLDSRPEDWQQTFATNVFGPVHLSRLFSAELQRRSSPGSILFLGSIHQWITGGWPEYSASKSALTMLVRELALELGPLGIRVNAIAPGWVAAPGSKHAESFDHSPLAGRAIPPRYVARAAVYLSSPYFSAFTTGTTLSIDGGLSVRSYRTPARGRFADPHVRKWT